MTFEIRFATSGDAPAIVQVIQTVYDEYGFILDVANDMPDLVDIDGRYDRKHGAFFVAVLDGRVIGTAGMQIHEADTAELFRMYLLAEQRSNGYGYRLLDTAVIWAREQGVGQITLWSDVLLPLAHKLYTRYGFVQGVQRQVVDANNSVEYQFTLRL